MAVSEKCKWLGKKLMVEQRANNIKLKNNKAHNLKVLFVHFDWVSQMLLTSKYVNWK